MLYIMRHGKTDWNLEYRLQGRTNIPLNDQGRQMAEVAREEYKDVHFDKCFCSPLIRARETADILLKDRDVPIIEDERLVEMCFGKYEGMDHIYQKPDCPIRTLFLDPGNYETAEGTESLEELYQRTGEFLKEVALPLVEKGEDILIMGHGAMNSCIVCQIRNIPRERFWEAGIENCKLMKLI